jgi:hypothetical protein
MANLLNSEDRSARSPALPIYLGSQLIRALEKASSLVNEIQRLGSLSHEITLRP